jgi:hypothetical protein
LMLISPAFPPRFFSSSSVSKFVFILKAIVYPDRLGTK